MSDNSLSVFFPRLREGDSEAAARIWAHFYKQLVAVANSKLKERIRRVVDGEDVAQSVFDSCFRAIKEGRVPELHDRDNLWALLVTIAGRKASNANRDHHAAKRGGGKVLGESVFLTKSASFNPGIEGVAGDEPDGPAVVEIAEQVELRLGMLSEDARQIAELKLAGYKNREIAERLNFSIAKVERKLSRIRNIWSASTDEDSTESDPEQD